MDAHPRFHGAVLTLLMAWLASAGCERGDVSKTRARGRDVPAPDVLVFPREVQVADPAVNAFLAGAMRTCTSGEYEPFRLLWSADTDPLPRERFENHWRAVEKIHILALEKDPHGQEAYAVYADLFFDPDQLPARHELHDHPQRPIVLLIVREHDQWRLAKASKAVRAWMAKKVKSPEEEASAPPDEADRQSASSG
jgi:hypothetical protein